MENNNSNTPAAATPSKDAVFRAFDSYPWTKDRAFQELLSKELFADSDVAPAEVALACRLQRFEEKVGVYLDPYAYQAYRAAEERPRVDLVPPFILEQERLEEVCPSSSDRTPFPPNPYSLALLRWYLHNGPQPVVARRKYAALAGDADHVPSEPGAEGEAPAGTAGPAAPLWQLAAPKADLYISKADAATGEAGKEPYPKKFEEIIEFLQSGKEIPGIQKIPDTVISDPVSSKHTLSLPVQTLGRHGTRRLAADRPSRFPQLQAGQCPSSHGRSAPPQPRPARPSE